MARFCVALCVLLVANPAFAETPKPVAALKRLDPVELVGGKEVAGKDDLTAEWGLFRYHFATPANKAAFEKAPEAFAVQFGGVCMKMGPLSGQGGPDRFHVHAGRVYLFASESCRNAFKAAPEKFIDAPDPAPAGTDDHRKRGRELVELLVKGLGGAKAVDSVTGVETRYGLSYPQKDKPPFLMTRTVTAAFPGRYREEDAYTGWSGAAGVDGASGFQTTGSKAWAVEESVRAFLDRRMLREPLAIAKSRGEAGFVAVASGSGTIDGADVEWLTVGVRGATTSLALDTKTGRVLRAKYKDRAGGPLGEVAKSFGDFREVGGVVLPHTVALSYDGTPVASPATTIEAIAVNPKLDAKLFQCPK